MVFSVGRVAHSPSSYIGVKLNDLVIADGVKSHYNKILKEIYGKTIESLNAIANIDIGNGNLFALPQYRDVAATHIEYLQKVLNDHDIKFEGRDSFRARTAE